VPRIRTVKPEFFKNWKLYSAEREEGLPLRLAFESLWSVSDREGRFEWIPEQLKVECLPYDDLDFSRVLHALWTRGYIEKYEVDGQLFAYIPSWHEHQVINNRESPSNLPEPNEINTLTREARVSHAKATPLKHALVEGKGREGKGKRVSDASLPDWLDKEAWATWNDHRAELRKKQTAKSIASQIRFLEKYKADHTAILDQSVRNGWTGLFELKADYRKPEPSRTVKDFPA
jgi:hypothetical protein